jgi:hypothetical protein
MAARTGIIVADLGFRIRAGSGGASRSHIEACAEVLANLTPLSAFCILKARFLSLDESK